MKPKTRRLRLWWVIGLMIVTAGRAAAQTTPADYAIRSIRTEFAQGGAETAIVFDVVNNGGASTITATAQVLDNTGATIGFPVTVPPLGANESAPVRIEFPTYLFVNSAGQIVSLTATVGIGEVEAAGSDTASDNNARISLNVPNLNAIVPEGQDTAPAQTAPPTQTDAITLEGLLRGDPVTIGTVTIPDGRLLLIGIVIAFFVLLITLWIITIILRALFSRPAIFPNWQPPYTPATYLDPNSLNGRRGLWQPHAQSDALPVPCQPGTFAARKLLMGVNGVKLNGWRVVGVRLNQYDMYGRVARSQVIGTPGVVKQLDRLARRSGTMDMARAERRVRGVANKLTSDFRRKLSKRSAMLPLAMDIRLDGRHGEIRLVFELHQCMGDAYQPIDTWEPETVVTTHGGIIHENFTYTLYGQRQGESVSQFTKRLRADMTRTLAHMVAGMSAPPPAAKPAPKDRQTPPTPPSIPPAPTSPPELGDTAQVNTEVDPTPAPGRTTPQSRQP